MIGINESVYWTTKEGKKMNIDDMEPTHIKNVLKLVLRNIAKATKKNTTSQFTLNGDIAQMFNDQEVDDELFGDLSNDPEWYKL